MPIRPQHHFVILLYHGVTRSAHRGIENASLKHLGADEFDRQMRHLASHYDVLGLQEALERREHGHLPEHAVVVTFDDGFENNHSVAFPILQQHGIPATFYLSTGFIGSPRVFWVDKVEYLLNESPLRALTLDSLAAGYTLDSPQNRKRALAEIKGRLKSEPALVGQTIAEMEAVCQTPNRYDYEDYRTLSWDQVREMNHSELYRFGSHSVDHAILSQFSRPEKEHQIRASKETLEDELQEEIHDFSYPEGRSMDYDAETIELLEAAGFTSSPSAEFGVNTEHTSVYHLKRNMVGFTASFEACLDGA